MKLTRASSYAIHAIAYMAQHKHTDKPVASHIIADDRGIPERFLLKVLKPLVSDGVLKSVKGPNGGYRLSRKPEDVTLLDIVQAVDGPIRGIAPLNEERKNALDAKLQIVCNQAADALKVAMKKVKITDLIAAAKR
ncbi:MAG: Rrf2 family transcriptional regulator [Verrucomicrobiaceae bacterium]|nr:Rrf2 family transcriptional regulator [Planctomycetota bacterium]RLS40208.1 MAG: Rrf2 family transcriptional regulator [Planctomycetota bacterium]